MPRVVLAVVCAVLTSLSLSAQRKAAPAAVPRAERTVPFRVGETLTYDSSDRCASFTCWTTSTIKTDFAVSPVVQDALSALYVVRAVPFVAGDRMTMPICDNGTTYKVQIDIGAQERVRTPRGEVTAWKVKPTIFDDKSRPVGRNIAFWLSDDARRLPVKF